MLSSQNLPVRAMVVQTEGIGAPAFFALPETPGGNLDKLVDNMIEEAVRGQDKSFLRYLAAR